MTRFRYRLPIVPLAGVLIAIFLFQIRITFGQSIGRSLETRVAIAETHNREQNRRIGDVEKRQEEFEKLFVASQLQYAELRLRIEYVLWITGGIGIFLIGNAGNFLVDLVKRRLLAQDKEKQDTED